jgi:hypothetical protein
MERTGRIFGSRGNHVFEYHPLKQESTTLVLYPQGEYVVWLTCTSSNSLMVSRRQGKVILIDVFSIE